MISLAIATILSAGACVYHLVEGKQKRLPKLMNTPLSEPDKQWVSALFYCQSVFYLSTTAVFLVCALKLLPEMYGYSLLLFLGLNYGMYAIWLFYVALLSPPQASLRLRLQSLVFLLIALLAVLSPLQLQAL
ncbi:hypothetical protein K0H59_08335 [Shewanella sp. FJAT-51649]|uniref:hypothetical protein n=1 Tax=Shewanella sp. FJAT-51649 TaxID=2864210 RepID=UPI001C6569AB|nr:hypothetical protein [Shewanella sp. FJAT-51649]QYJ73007.1 hypothetical protein K0H59_08335 [Shewanella sp. FJAT-51649]